MRRRSILLPLLLALPLAGLSGVPAQGSSLTVDLADGVAVPDSYIVTVRDGADPRAVAGASTVTPSHVYSAVLNGFAAKLDPVQLASVLTHSDVVAVEQDQVVTKTDTFNTVYSGWDSWGLDRIDQRNLPLSNTFTVTGTASTVHAYVFDTGIRYTHVLFGGRAVFHYDAFGGDGTDCDGHGSHVSGNIGGVSGTFITGAARAVQIHVVRVLDCFGNGTVAGIIAAADFTRLNHASPAVANMSLGVNGISTSLDTAVNNLIGAGVFTAIAAGNNSQNACNFSPGRVAAALTVAASSRTDNRATFSNHGSCVDLYGPGVDIWSAWYDGDGNIARTSGTSQATPHAAGVAALYLATDPGATPATTHAYLVNNATNGVIKKNRIGTPNKLLYSNNL